ncbi:MAG: LysR family transcriptional regulator [Rhodobacteraceae bacterium]|nr:MAG: LysR family transcriptional regulator [Paracoccaceae bacterium]
MLPKGVTLRGLEVFEALAQSGSVARAARATGLSQPAVSQQMKNLEAALGTALLDHARRPMQLTSAGRSFLARTETVLAQLRLAQSELTVMDLTHLSTLNLGMIDDFDTDLTPRLATLLAESLTRCRFRLVSAPSHEISTMVREARLHVAVAASTGEVLENVTEFPLVRDPFILVAPRDADGAPDELIQRLPFLRYDSNQLIGRQIEAQMGRLQLEFEGRFEIGSHPALMALVARGMGWAVTTPLGFMRSTRSHPDLAAHPLPFAGFARTISLFASADWTDEVPRDVARTVRRLVQEVMIAPARAQLPWLQDDLRLID